MKNERDRAWRRYQADRVATRRVDQYKNANSYENSFLRIAVLGRWRDKSPFGCNCRKRAKGMPHCGGGICHFMVRSPVVLKRRDGKRQCQEWMASVDHWDTDPAARSRWIERTW